MTEPSKTISLLVATAAILSLALATRPSSPSGSTESLIGKPLFASLDDPSKVLKAKRLKIVSFDERSARPQEFEVVQSGGAWTLPAHNNYPVDADKQLAVAAAALVDLKVLDKVGHDDVREHELYGVVEPKPDQDQVGKQGLGKLVIVDDGDGTKPIARLIVGKQDKPSHADDFSGSQTELHFVRIPGQDRVYRVALKADKFSTKFEDWVETDLLKLKSWDVAKVKLRDYSVPEVISAAGQYKPKVDRRSDIDLTFDDQNSKWELKQLTDYKGQKPQEVKLKEDEELNLTALNDLKNALGSLKIVNVSQKPGQMSANLRVSAKPEEFINNESFNDLLKRGFPVLPVGAGQLEIVANEGEAVVSMKDGVEFVLRFGAELVGADDSAADEKEEAKDGTKSDEAGKEGNGKKADRISRRRYLMVMAQFNPDMIAKPELEPDPDAKAEKPADSAASASDKKGDAKAAPKGGDAKAAAKGTDAKSADKKGDAAKADAKSADAKSDESKADSKPNEEDADVREAERARIEKENRRKQDEYNDKLKQGQQHAKELNARFADWYYIVSNDTYRKIHLGKDDIVKKKPVEKPAETTPPPNTLAPKSAPTKSNKK